MYSLFDTHSAVGFACREASFVNKASLLPHVTSPVNPASPGFRRRIYNHLESCAVRPRKYQRTDADFKRAGGIGSGVVVSLYPVCDALPVGAGGVGIGPVDSLINLRPASVSNGAHTLEITANDGTGGTATRTYTFSKNVSEIEFQLATPLATDDAVTKAIITARAGLVVYSDSAPLLS